MCGRSVNDLNTLAIKELTELVEVFVIRVRRFWIGSRLSIGPLGHPIQHILVRDQRSALRSSPGAGDISAGIGDPRRYDDLVASRMVGIHTRIDDEANRLR